MKTLTFHPKYGDIREDGWTVVRDVDPQLAEEICRCVNHLRATVAARQVSEDGLYWNGERVVQAVWYERPPLPES